MPSTFNGNIQSRRISNETRGPEVLKNIPPHTPFVYSKTGVWREIPILIFDPKQIVGKSIFSAKILKISKFFQ